MPHPILIMIMMSLWLLLLLVLLLLLLLPLTLLLPALRCALLATLWRRISMDQMAVI